MKQFFNIFVAIFVTFFIGCSKSSRGDAAVSAMPSWIGATVSFLENERRQIGDSITLSPYYFLRLHLLSEARRCFSDNDSHVTLSGTPQQVLQLMSRHGALTENAYHPRHGGLNHAVLARKVETAVRSSRTEAEALQRAADVVDEEIDYLPRMVFLFGAEYTPLEYAHSIALESDYRWIDHEPQGGWTSPVLQAGHAVWYGSLPHSLRKAHIAADEHGMVALEIVGVSPDGRSFQIADTCSTGSTIPTEWIEKHTRGVLLNPDRSSDRGK